MYKELSLDKLVEVFLQRGGRINDYYLKKSQKGPSLVYFNGWFRGKNVRDAITRALVG
ncbi:MAG: hypothetical protein NUV98_04785 [Candidatus Roizmanbacteria bacterium]|nr:hypothetical protein [Candidatus Roizmanbacteria bacterium]